MPLYQIDKNKNFVPVQDTKKRWELTYTYNADNNSMGFTGNTDEITDYIQENFNNITCLSLCIQASAISSSVLLFTKGSRLASIYSFFHNEANNVENYVLFSVGLGSFGLSNINTNYIGISDTGTAILTIY